MTALASWISVDSRAPSGAYIATDSRISWTTPEGQTTATWDRGRKTFASTRYPDIFGYLGDVLFPSLLLGQFIDALDLGLLVPSSATLRARQSALETFVQQSLQDSRAVTGTFAILHVGRANSGLRTVFETTTLKWAKGRLTRRHLLSPHQSSVLRLGSEYTRREAHPLIDGSGAKQIQIELAKWEQGKHAHTSRSVFSSFCDSLSANTESTVGGLPQLVSLRREGCAQTVGIFYGGRSSILGNPGLRDTSGSTEYRNELFERVHFDGQLIANAQQHTRRDDQPLTSAHCIDHQVELSSKADLAVWRRPIQVALNEITKYRQCSFWVLKALARREQRIAVSDSAAPSNRSQEFVTIRRPQDLLSRLPRCRAEMV